MLVGISYLDVGGPPQKVQGVIDGVGMFGLLISLPVGAIMFSRQTKLRFAPLIFLLPTLSAVIVILLLSLVTIPLINTDPGSNGILGFFLSIPVYLLGVYMLVEMSELKYAKIIFTTLCIIVIGIFVGSLVFDKIHGSTIRKNARSDAEVRRILNSQFKVYSLPDSGTWQLKTARQWCDFPVAGLVELTYSGSGSLIILQGDEKNKGQLASGGCGGSSVEPRKLDFVTAEGRPLWAGAFSDRDGSDDRLTHVLTKINNTYVSIQYSTCLDPWGYGTVYSYKPDCGAEASFYAELIDSLEPISESDLKMFLSRQ